MFGIYVVYITFLIIISSLNEHVREEPSFHHFKELPTPPSLAVVNTLNAASFVGHSPGSVYGSCRIPSPRHLVVHGRRDPLSHLTRLITQRSYFICDISNYSISLSLSLIKCPPVFTPSHLLSSRTSGKVLDGLKLWDHPEV